MAPRVSRRRVGETWAAKYRAERGVRAYATPTSGTSLSHTPMGCCVPQGGPVLTAYALCARRIRLRPAPPKGRARTMGDGSVSIRVFGGRRSQGVLKGITPATSTAKMRYTLGKLVPLPLTLSSVSPQRGWGCQAGHVCVCGVGPKLYGVSVRHSGVPG